MMFNALSVPWSRKRYRRPVKPLAFASSISDLEGAKEVEELESPNVVLVPIDHVRTGEAATRSSTNFSRSAAVDETPVGTKVGADPLTPSSLLKGGRAKTNESLAKPNKQNVKSIEAIENRRKP